jgi:NADH-quinone oxidoreductase subunit E
MNLKPETIAEIEKVIPQYPQTRSALLPVLHAVQADQGYVSDEAMEWIAGKLGIQPVNVLEVVTFYPYFRRTPFGKHHVRVCRTLSCSLNNSFHVGDVFEQEFGCKLGENSADGLVTLESTECLASCATGPNVLIDGTLYQHVDEAKARELAAKIKAGEKV